MFGKTHRPRRQGRTAVALALTLALFGAACGDDDDASGSTGSPTEETQGSTGGDGGGATETLLISGDLDITGPRQATGAPQVDGARAAVEAINAAGGITVGDTTYLLEFEPLDHANDPTRVVANARQLLEDEPLAVLSPSLQFDAFYNLLKDQTIVIGSAFPEQGYLAEDPDAHPQLIVQIPSLLTYYGAMLAQAKTQFPEIESVALLNVDNENGHPEAEGIAAAAEASGFEVVDSIFYPEGTQDFTPFLSRLDGTGVDLIIGPINPADSIPLLGQAAQLQIAPFGLTQALVPSDLGDLSAFSGINLIMSHFSATFDEYNFDDIKDAGAELVELAGNQPIVPEIAVDMWNTIHLLAMAIEEAGTVDDRAAIVEAMQRVTYEGPFGPATLDENHSVVGWAMNHFVIDGKVIVAQYDSIEEAEPARTQEFDL